MTYEDLFLEGYYDALNEMEDSYDEYDEYEAYNEEDLEEAYLEGYYAALDEANKYDEYKKFTPQEKRFRRTNSEIGFDPTSNDNNLSQYNSQKIRLKLLKNGKLGRITSYSDRTTNHKTEPEVSMNKYEILKKYNDKKGRLKEKAVASRKTKSIVYRDGKSIPYSSSLAVKRRK